MLGGADQIQILALDLIHHRVHVGLAHDALDDVAVDHERRDAVDKALVDHEIARIGQHGRVQPRDVAHQIIKAVAGDAAGGVHVDAAEALHDLRVIGDRKIGHDGLAEALNLHVGAVVRADRHGGVDDVGDVQHQRADARGAVLLQLFQLLKPLGVGLHLGLDLLGLGELGRVLFRLTHQHADLLGKAVAAGAQLAGLGDGGAVLRVELQHLVHHGQLVILKLFLDVFLDDLRIFPDKLDIQHVLFRPYFFPAFSRPNFSSSAISASRSSAP